MYLSYDNVSLFMTSFNVLKCMQLLHVVCINSSILYDHASKYDSTRSMHDLKSSLSFWCIYFNVSIPYDFKSYYLVKHLQELSVVLSLKIFEFNVGLKGIREANRCYNT